MMYLKSIRAQGFKSFADKLDLEINPGITGIVGPNGSGKSNIVDAVRWVLGEQSAKSLRSGAMSDVIFNGSESRDAQKRAMVALTFDNSDHYLNSDFNEIEVKRIVYNTGENEYYLNNSRVRLKEITDLFIESGAGLTSFNIISQGNVTDIVNSKSDDRRVIFEATAQVLKYKKRKEESLRKLEKTEENLLRINLVIKELETTILPLKEQSIKAQKYVDIKKDLESIDIALICNDITNFNEEYQTLKKEIEVLKKTTADFSEEKDATLEKLKLKSLSLEDKLNTKRTKLLELTKKLSSLNNEKLLTIERGKYNVTTEQINENLVKLKEEELNYEKSIAVLTEEITKINNDIKNNKKDYDLISDELLNCKIKKSTKEENLGSKNIEIFNLHNQIKILENNILNDTSSPLAVRSVLNNPTLSGIHSSVSKLIEVEDKYLVSLDIALGSSKNTIVVSDEEAAIKAINYLKEKKLGRATFYPLNVIKPRTLSQEVLSKIKDYPGFIGVFSNLVKYDKKYENIVTRELGTVLLVKDMDTMKKLGTTLDHKYKIVTIDGEIENPGGSITGGTYKNKSIVNDKNELNKLKEKINSLTIDTNILTKEIEDLTKKIQELSTKENNYVKLNFTFEETLASKENSLKELATKKEDLKSELEGMEALKDNKINDKILVLLEEIKVTEKDKEILEKEINDLSKEKNDLNEEINITEKEIRVKNAEINSKLNELKNKEVTVAKIEVKLDNLLVYLNEEYNMTYEYAINNYFLDIEDDIAREKVNSLKKELNKLGEVNVAAIGEYERLNKRYEFLTNQKEDLTKASGELKDIIKEMDEIMIEKFKTTFEKVKGEFSRIFKMMFKGGKGELRLSDPDDILNTGIDIIAIPPGKKINSPLLLSGGEKALTAICLLFAMLEVRPAPFIILDEAEAALDEANVDMFGRYLMEEKSKSQFIVITHKKRMMEYADVLYGITMQESGVSKIVSTKLENK